MKLVSGFLQLQEADLAGTVNWVYAAARNQSEAIP
jgi:hypothetical protein